MSEKKLGIRTFLFFFYGPRFLLSGALLQKETAYAVVTHLTTRGRGGAKFIPQILIAQNSRCNWKLLVRLKVFKRKWQGGLITRNPQLLIGLLR